MGIRENKVERYLDSEVKKLRGTTRKFVSPGHDGVADRLCFLPGGHLWLVEVKTDSGIISSPQKREKLRMTKLGFRSNVVFGNKGVDVLIRQIQSVLDRDMFKELVK